MDRFGYAKTIEPSAYERNKEAADRENRYVFRCMNTDKICIFTDNGNLHQIKLINVPYVRFKDKGTPVDNLGNYDSKDENIVFVTDSMHMNGKKLLFTTKNGMMKLVDSSEFSTANRTVMATKLGNDDKLVSVVITNAYTGSGYTEAGIMQEDFEPVMLSGGSDEFDGFDMGDDFVQMDMMDETFMQSGKLITESEDTEGKEGEIITNEMVVLQTDIGFFLRFPLGEIPEKKKGAIGVKGIKLSDGDYITNVYVLDAGDNAEVEYKGKTVELRKIKTAKHGTKGTKIRV